MRREVSSALMQELERGLVDMRRSGGLAAWVEPRTLAARLASQITITSLQWVAGAVDDDALTATASYDACLILLGVARGRGRAELEQRAAAAQRKVATRFGEAGEVAATRAAARPRQRGRA